MICSVVRSWDPAALLKIDGPGAYREMWESEGRSRDITKQLAAVYQQILKREAPADPAAALAGIPSAVETRRSSPTH